MADIISLDPHETIKEDGRRFYEHDDIEACRHWLRRAGLEIKTGQGYVSDTRKGIIFYSSTALKWCASHYAR